MSNLLVDDISRELLNQGISVIHADADIPTFFDLYPGESVKPAILPNPTGLPTISEFCAIWCNEVEDTHFTPCEGEWDFADIAGIQEYCPIHTLTIAQGANGDVMVEIAWKDYEYTKRDLYAQMVHDAMYQAIPRVLATIAHNRARAI